LCPPRDIFEARNPKTRRIAETVRRNPAWFPRVPIMYPPTSVTEVIRPGAIATGVIKKIEKK
jgi:hypothetical protein